MKGIFKFLISMSLLAIQLGFTGDGMPLKFISSCEMDFNQDGRSDKAFLVEGIPGRELLVLLAKKDGYETFVVSKGKDRMFLHCEAGFEVKETIAINAKGKVYKTPGAYLKLVKPESSSVVYFWSKAGFQEVWTAD